MVKSFLIKFKILNKGSSEMIHIYTTHKLVALVNKSKGLKSDLFVMQKVKVLSVFGIVVFSWKV